MTQFARNRDNILNSAEIAKSARKCIGLLDNPEVTIGMSARDHAFFSNQQHLSLKPGYTPSEPTLQWLRDMVSRYVTD